MTLSWLVVSFATLTALIAAFLPGGLWVSALAAPVAIGVTVRNFRRDAFQSAVVTAFHGGAPLALVLYLSAKGVRVPPGALELGVALLPIPLACLGVIIWLQRAPEPWPNFFRGTELQSHCIELHDVQFCCRTEATADQLRFMFRVQNTLDAPRRFVMGFKPVSGGDQVVLPETSAYELKGGEVVDLEFNAVVRPGNAPVFDIELLPRIELNGGRRIRRWRASGYGGRRTTSTEETLSMLALHPHRQRGMVARIYRVPSQGASSPATLSTRATTLWLPPPPAFLSSGV